MIVKIAHYNFFLLLFLYLFLISCDDLLNYSDLEYTNDSDINSTKSFLNEYYEMLEKRKLSFGLLRQDGGGDDTPFDSEDIITSFQQLAFYTEYNVTDNKLMPSASSVNLAKWKSDIIISSEFGSSLSNKEKEKDLAHINAVSDILSKAIGIKINFSNQNPNIHIIVGNETELPQLINKISLNLSDFDPKIFPLISQLPKDIHCITLTALKSKLNPEIVSALVIIRNELPKLLRKACFHEEMAQSLGLSNDSHLARPSIFNDDDEFATLTEFDEILLKILYDERLETGMTLRNSSEILRTIANEIDTST